jgi:hypothetical protein
MVLEVNEFSIAELLEPVRDMLGHYVGVNI